MSIILRKGRLTQQPLYPAPLDRDDSLTTDLAFAVNPAVGPFDSVAGAWASTWNRAQVATAQGLALYGAGVGQVAEWSYGPIVGSNGNGSGGITFAVLANPFAEARESCLIGVIMNGAPYKQIALYANMDGNAGGALSGTLSVEAYNSANQGYGNASGVVDGQFHVFVGVFRSGVDATLYVDGVDATSSFGAGVGGTGLGDFGTDASSRISVGSESYNSTTRIVNCQLPFAAAWNRALTREEVIRLNERVWRVWRAPTRRLWAVSATTAATGTVAYTNANDTLAASGTTTVTGTLAKTNANDTSAASGATTVTGSLSKTNANDTSSASGTTTITGTLARTNANDSVSASGSVGSAVSGTLAYTNANDTSTASGTTTVTGSLAKTNANDSSSATGTTTIAGSLAKTNADDTVSASGTVTSGSTGTVAYTNKNDTLSASGTTTILGSLAQTNRNDSLAASGIVNSGIIIESALTDGVTTTIRIKKPGVPTGTPDWLKTLLEIILGRRGNKIAVPAEQNLTFSSTPTQAECQALYSYVNQVRDSLDSLVNRLDS